MEVKETTRETALQGKTEVLIAIAAATAPTASPASNICMKKL